jgi:hypothetical protein
MDNLQFGGRQVPQQIHLPLIGAWLQICEQAHGSSCAQAPLIHLLVTPQYLKVIDVKLKCVVDAPAACNYVALSYVWGSSNKLRLTRETYGTMHTAGFFAEREAPRTIGDAMAVVEGCGQRFLWVDALCIIQDDVSDRTFHLGQMGTVYQTALFTIFATGSDHADSGLAGVRVGTRDISQHRVELGDFRILSLMNDWGFEVDNSAWKQRAWTLQEGVFSRRSLFFTSKQMHWRCSKAHWCEETVRETNIFHDLGRLEDSWGGYRELQLALTPRLLPRSQMLYQMLTAYTLRHLTFEGDVLNAIAGISGAITRLHGSDITWGLPQSRVSDSLA